MFQFQPSFAPGPSSSSPSPFFWNQPGPAPNAVQRTFDYEQLAPANFSPLHGLNQMTHHNLGTAPMTAASFQPAQPTRPQLTTSKPKRIRTAFTTNQILFLEKQFSVNRFIETHQRLKLAKYMGLNDKVIKTWFQNRRMKDKRAGIVPKDDQEGSLDTTTSSNSNVPNSSYPYSLTNLFPQKNAPLPYQYHDRSSLKLVPQQYLEGMQYCQGGIPNNGEVGQLDWTGSHNANNHLAYGEWHNGYAQGAQSTVQCNEQNTNKRHLEVQNIELQPVEPVLPLESSHHQEKGQESSSQQEQPAILDIDAILDEFLETL